MRANHCVPAQPNYIGDHFKAFGHASIALLTFAEVALVVQMVGNGTQAVATTEPRFWLRPNFAASLFLLQGPWTKAVFPWFELWHDLGAALVLIPTNELKKSSRWRRRSRICAKQSGTRTTQTYSEEGKRVWAQTLDHSPTRLANPETYLPWRSWHWVRDLSRRCAGLPKVFIETSQCD